MNLRAVTTLATVVALGFSGYAAADDFDVEGGSQRLWDLRSCREDALFIGDDPVRCCIVSRAEQTAVVGDSRGRVLIFDLPATRGKGNKFKAPDQLQDSTPAERRAAMTWAQRLKRVFMR